MFGGIGKAISSIAVTKKIPLQSISMAQLNAVKNLPSALTGRSGLPGLGGLLSTFSSADLLANKNITANPALRDALLALQKQAGNGNAKAVANAYSKF
ncbi:hypothetical protein [Ensifer adhaerens]|uniref:hypothetical protein n=1 Tax=Ensifer adhaerens TaxID=106592 RepID=UPI0008074C5D|nr:hypothetical protein [Ensifer adhaerens]